MGQMFDSKTVSNRIEERLMLTMNRALVLALLAVCLGACDKADDNDPKAMRDVKEGVSKVGEGIAEGWDSMMSELSAKGQELDAKLAEAKPEVKAKLEGLKATFDEKWALAKQKMADAKAAAPEKVEALKREAREAYEAAKQAWSNAVS